MSMEIRWLDSELRRRVGALHGRGGSQVSTRAEPGTGRGGAPASLRSLCRGTCALLLACAALLAPGPAAAQAPSISGVRGMVSTSVGPSARIGAEILAAGGNAVDAAVALGFAAGCAHQFSSGIGGGGFFVIWDAKTQQAYSLDAREIAPAATTQALYRTPDGRPDADVIREGGRAVAVPMLVPGFEMAHQRFGKLPWDQVIAPAIQLCREGVEVSMYHQQVLRLVRDKLRRFPETERIQLAPPRKEIPEFGARIVQEDLAKTYERIAKEGADAMRRGPIVDAIVEAVKRDGGVLSATDLAEAKPRWREPVRGTYRGYELVSMPPPSSGGVHVIQMLNALEPIDLKAWPRQSPQMLDALGEIMKVAFADRAFLMGDPDFVPVPVEFLTSKEYGVQTARRIERVPWYRRAPWKWGKSQVLQIRTPAQPPRPDSGTTHISVIDADGNAVALTQTVNTLFGSLITAKGTGIVLNNEMDDFSLGLDTANSFGLVGSTANEIAPGKRPLSSMTPTILLRDGKAVMAVGSPQGPYIITTVLQTIVNYVDYGMDIQQAVSAPRIHHQWMPDELRLEPEYKRDVAEALRKIGHAVKLFDEHFGVGAAVVRDPQTGVFSGGADPRRDARAAAP
jgi:gamma-glutamyltranspeptidase / glutathione hydrolase